MSKSFKLASVYFDLSVMFESGIPVMRALDTVSGHTKGPMRRIFSEIRKSVSQKCLKQMCRTRILQQP